MGKVTAAQVAALKALFDHGDTMLEASFAAIMDTIADAAEDHEHASGGGPGSGTGDAKPLYTIGAFVWIIPGSVDTGATQGPRLRGLPDITFIEAELLIKTAPTGAALIVDINKNGTSLWPTSQEDRPELAIAATEGESTTFETTTGTDDDVYTIDIDQKGSTEPGVFLTVILWFKQYATHDD